MSRVLQILVIVQYDRLTTLLDVQVGELKQILNESGVDFRDCFEKAELVGSASADVI